MHTPLSLERVFSFVFWPLSWLLGVSAEDVPKVATLLGQKSAKDALKAAQQVAMNAYNSTAH